MDEARLSVWVAGRVQGVGFRYWTQDRAGELGLRGSAGNLPDGRVEILVEGPRDACQALLDVLGGDDTPGDVGEITHSWNAPAGEPAGFRVR